jgi:hypothetical protein
MNVPICIAPVPSSALVEYWFGELAQHDEERVEEHLLGCEQCSRRLGKLADLGAGIRSAFRNGEVWAVISPAFLQKMKQEGLRLREYPVAPGTSVNCTISSADDAVVSRLQASLEGATRVDLVHLSEQGEGRLSDIPFEPAAGEVLYCPSAASLKKSPAHTATVRLLRVDGAGEHPIGEYTFIHTPS